MLDLLANLLVNSMGVAFLWLMLEPLRDRRATKTWTTLESWATGYGVGSKSDGTP